jgi:hypothetical protein
VFSLLALLAGANVQILTHARAGGGGRARGIEFTCFTGTKVQIMTRARAGGESAAFLKALVRLC